MVRAVAVAAVLVLAAGAEARDGVVVDEPSEILAAAKRAIRSRKGGVFVVRVEGTSPLARWRYWHIFTIDEVVKPYRTDEGTYFIPLMCNETTPTDGSRLVVGGRYLLVTRLKWASFSPLYMERAFRVDDGKDHAPLLADIRAAVGDDAEYGSSSYLRRELGRPLEVSGVQTNHADGFIDPAPFGFTEESVRKAMGEGMQVLLVRPREGRDTYWEKDVHVDVLADLGHAGKRGEALWVRDPWTHDEKVARNTKMPAPYRFPKWCPHRRYVVLLDPRGEGPPVVQALLPVTADDDRTVRKVRSWLPPADGADGAEDEDAHTGGDEGAGG